MYKEGFRNSKFKSYPTFDVCAYIFASSKTSTCDWVKDITPLLEDTLVYAKVLPERQLQSIEEFHILFPDTKEILIDGVERPIQRPSKDKTQKKHYSGKKKRHTRKSIIITDTKKKVLVLAPTKHGRVHDKKMSDKFSLIERIPEDVAIYGDSGFQGIQKQHHNTYIPFKGTKKNQLSKDQKWWNTQVSHVRVRVEHALSGMKRFKIFADILRAKCGKDDRWSRIVAGLWNLHLSFT